MNRSWYPGPISAYIYIYIYIYISRRLRALTRIHTHTQVFVLPNNKVHVGGRITLLEEDAVERKQFALKRGRQLFPELGHPLLYEGR